MDKSMVQISSNWTQIGGCPFEEAFQLFTADPDIFLKPDFDDIVNEEKSILLSKSDCSDCCELYIKIYPHYKIQSLSLVCNAAKIETFFGQIKEYFETVYGVIIDELDDEFKTYRYDIEVEKSGVTDLTLKFLTHSNDVCIFGIILYLAPNPNGITTLLQSTQRFNNDNIKTESRNDTNISEQFLELMKITKKLNRPNCSNTAIIDELSKMKIAEERQVTDQVVNDAVINQLKCYIDERLKKLEERIQCRLDQIEESQIRKFDDILSRLENKM